MMQKNIDPADLFMVKAPCCMSVDIPGCFIIAGSHLARLHELYDPGMISAGNLYIPELKRSVILYDFI